MELLQFAGLVALLSIVAQTGAMFYWGGKLHTKVMQHDEDIYDHEDRLRVIERGGV